MERIENLGIIQKKKVKMIQKSERKSQSSCSTGNENVFDLGLDDSGCQNILFNCLNNLEKSFYEIFD